MMSKRGLIAVISGPSGSGKGTLINKVETADSNLCYAVSATTREVRRGEAEGVTYYYKSEEEFDRLVESGEVLEWDQFCGHKYGTLRKELEDKISQGHDVLLDLTISGAMAIKEAFPDDAVTIYVVPPSIEELERRIRHRQRETEEQLKMRVNAAADEVKSFTLFDYVIVNDELSEAVDRLLAVIKAERVRYSRNKDILDRLNLKG